MLKTLRKFEDNPEVALGASLGIGIKIQKQTDNNKKLDFLETDYH